MLINFEKLYKSHNEFERKQMYLMAFCQMNMSPTDTCLCCKLERNSQVDNKNIELSELGTICYRSHYNQSQRPLEQVESLINPLSG